MVDLDDGRIVVSACAIATVPPGLRLPIWRGRRIGFGAWRDIARLGPVANIGGADGGRVCEQVGLGLGTRTEQHLAQPPHRRLRVLQREHHGHERGEHAFEQLVLRRRECRLGQRQRLSQLPA